MEHKWSLKELYDSFESIVFKEDMAKLEDYIHSFKDFGNQLSYSGNLKKTLEEYISLYKNMTTLFNKLLAMLHLILCRY